MARFEGNVPWLMACSHILTNPMRVQYPNELLTSVSPKYQRDQLAGDDSERTPMSLAQASYLMTLCEETHEVMDDSLTQAEAALRIAELEEATGRSSGHGRERRSK